MDSITESAEYRGTDTLSAPPEGLADLLTGAVGAARAAIEEQGGDVVGEYLGATFEDATAATHRFLANVPGYKGWQWAVVVAAYPGADHATISEVVLVPGPTALLAPQWVPWDQRVRPGDLGPGDLLATPADDPRLVPGHALTGDPEIDDVAVELGLGRRQVLGVWGRTDAAERWHDGDYGPESAMARSTKRVCRDCGYFLPLAGSLGAMFGVCANEMSADGHVVDFTYGCGAHSDTPAPAGTGSPLYDPYDDGVLDVALNPVTETPEVEPAQADTPAETAETPAVETPEAETAETPETPAVETPEAATAEADGAETPAAENPESPAVAEPSD